MGVERSLFAATKVLPSPFGGGLGIGPSLRQRPQARGALVGIGNGENTVRQGIGVRRGFREVQRVSLAGPLRQHPTQRVAIQNLQSLPRLIEEQLKNIYTKKFSPRNCAPPCQSGAGQSLLRMFGSPELDDVNAE